MNLSSIPEGIYSRHTKRSLSGLQFGYLRGVHLPIFSGLKFRNPSSIFIGEHNNEMPHALKMRMASTIFTPTSWSLNLRGYMLSQQTT
jgi:hypothetical protein